MIVNSKSRETPTVLLRLAEVLTQEGVYKMVRRDSLYAGVRVIVVHSGPSTRVALYFNPLDNCLQPLSGSWGGTDFERIPNAIVNLSIAE
jgi:hypothetical protein